MSGSLIARSNLVWSESVPLTHGVLQAFSGSPRVASQLLPLPDPSATSQNKSLVLLTLDKVAHHSTT